MKNIVVEAEDVKNILIASFKSQLESNYASPARDVITRVFQELSPEFEKVIREVLSELVADEAFKTAVREEFRHKVAKLLVGDLSGAVEKAVNEFRANPTLKSRMVMAIEDIISDAKE